MENIEMRQATSSATGETGMPAPGATVGAPPEQQGGAASCPTCGTPGTQTPPSYVYALGRIEPRFPRLSVEKEFAQVLAQGDTKGQPDRQALQSVLSKPENRYLVRLLC